VIEHEGVRLRRWREDDVDELQRLADDRDRWRNVRDIFPFPYTRSDAAGFIRFASTIPGPALLLAIEVEGALAGGIGLEPGPDVYRVDGELGYWVGKPYQGRGVATRAVHAIVHHGFATIGLERIHAEVFAWNPASARVLEKCGFQREAVLRRRAIKEGEVTDAWLYARLGPPE
jgi:RimJ/RimL family protein N-acetyltransferase